MCCRSFICLITRPSLFNTPELGVFFPEIFFVLICCTSEYQLAAGIAVWYRHGVHILEVCVESHDACGVHVAIDSSKPVLTILRPPQPATSRSRRPGFAFRHPRPLPCRPLCMPKAGRSDSLRKLSRVRSHPCPRACSFFFSPIIRAYSLMAFAVSASPFSWPNSSTMVIAKARCSMPQSPTGEGHCPDRLCLRDHFFFFCHYRPP